MPMVVRIVGTNAAEAARILAEAGDPDVQTAANPRRSGRATAVAAAHRGSRSPHEHPRRHGNAAARPGHHRARGRLPCAADAGLRHEHRRRRDAWQGRPARPGRPVPVFNTCHEAVTADRRQHERHLRPGRRRAGRGAGGCRRGHQHDLLHHRAHPRARHAQGRRTWSTRPARGSSAPTAPARRRPARPRSASSRARSIEPAMSASSAAPAL